MRTSLNLDDALLSEAKEITGLPTTEATVEEALRRLIRSHRQMDALQELEGMNGDGPHYSRPTFEALASEFRALTAQRTHTFGSAHARRARGAVTTFVVDASVVIKWLSRSRERSTRCLCLTTIR